MTPIEKALQDKDDEIAYLRNELLVARETSRRLNRRIQNENAELTAEKDMWKNEHEFWHRSWRQNSWRMHASNQQLSSIMTELNRVAGYGRIDIQDFHDGSKQKGAQWHTYAVIYPTNGEGSYCVSPSKEVRLLVDAYISLKSAAQDAYDIADNLIKKQQ